MNITISGSGDVRFTWWWYNLWASTMRRIVKSASIIGDEETKGLGIHWDLDLRDVK